MANINDLGISNPANAIWAPALIKNYFDAVSEYRKKMMMAQKNLTTILANEVETINSTKYPTIPGSVIGDKNVNNVNPEITNGYEDKINLSNNYSVPSYKTNESGEPEINPEASTYFTNRLNASANTQKGLLDFLNRLGEIEQNVGTYMDYTGSVIGEKPNEVRNEMYSKFPKIPELDKFVNNLEERRKALMQESESFGFESDIRDGLSRIQELSQKYPEAYSAIQNGYLSITPSGSLEFSKEATKRLNEDSREQIKSFFKELGTNGMRALRLSVEKGGLGITPDYKTYYEDLSAKYGGGASEKAPNLFITYEHTPDGKVRKVGEIITHPSNPDIVLRANPIPYMVFGYGINPDDEEKPLYSFKPHNINKNKINLNYVDKYIYDPRLKKYRLVDDKIPVANAFQEYQYKVLKEGERQYNWLDEKNYMNVSNINKLSYEYWTHLYRIAHNPESIKSNIETTKSGTENPEIKEDLNFFDFK